jgi:hypothetical protein
MENERTDRRKKEGCEISEVDKGRRKEKDCGERKTDLSRKRQDKESRE